MPLRVADKGQHFQAKKQVGNKTRIFRNFVRIIRKHFIICQTCTLFLLSFLFFFVLISIFFMLARLKHQRLLQPCHHSPLSYFYFRLYHSGFTLLSTRNSFKPLFPFIKIHRFVYKNKYIHIVSIFIRGVI